MNGKKTAFAERVSQNSKNYFPKDLFDLEAAGTFLERLHTMFGLVDDGPAWGGYYDAWKL